MDENIIIPIIVDEGPALNKLRSFSTQVPSAIGSIGAGRNGEINVDVRVRTNNAPTEIRNVGSAANVANTALKSLRPGASQVENALLNLNRVVQDSPYGFIGISNNISPLVESFQRLKRETGSSKAAFSALITGLTGAGGIGLAIAAVTAAVSFASIGFDMWTRRKQAAKVATDELANREKAFNEIVKQSNQRAGEQIGTLRTLNQTLTSTNVSAANKRKAYDKILEIYPSYKAELDADYKKNGNIANVITTRLIPAIIAAAKARAYQEKVNKLTSDNLDLEIRKNKENNELQKKRNDLDKSRAIHKIETNTPAAASAGIGASIGIGTNRQVIYSEEAVKLAEEAPKKTQALIDANTKSIDAFAASAVSLISKMDKLGVSGEDAGKGLKNTAAGLSEAATQSKAFADAQKNINNEIGYLDNQLEKGFLRPLDYAKQKFEILQKASKDFQINFKLAPDSTIVRDLDEQLRSLSSTIKLGSLKFQTTTEVSARPNLALPTPIVTAKESDWLREIANKRKELIDLGITEVFEDGVMVPVRMAIDTESMNASIAVLRAQGAAFKAAVEDVATDSISSFADGIGDAIGSGNGLANAFNQVGITLGRAMSNFGKQLIAGGIKILAAKNSMEFAISNPYLMIASGATLVAAGAAVTSALQRQSNQRLTGFANGGGVVSPGLAIVGEHSSTSRNNPELWGRFDQFKGLFGGLINDYANRTQSPAMAYSGSGGYPSEIVLKADGDALVAVLSKTQNRQSRNYGS